MEIIQLFSFSLSPMYLNLCLEEKALPSSESKFSIPIKLISKILASLTKNFSSEVPFPILFFLKPKPAMTNVFLGHHVLSSGLNRKNSSKFLLYADMLDLPLGRAGKSLQLYRFLK